MPVATKIPYTVLEGERYDQISQKAYGRPDMFNLIIQANPDVPIYDQFPAGVNLLLPLLDTVEVKTDAELLPPWKR